MSRIADRLQHSRAAWITAQHDEFLAMLLRAFDCELHRCVVLMALCVDEECVRPVHAACRTLIYVREVDAAALEVAQYARECAGFIGGLEHDAGLVVTVALCGSASEYKEAGEVVRVIFDVGEEHGETVKACTKFAADRGGICFASLCFFRDDLHCPAGTGRWNKPSLREFVTQPSSALTEDFGLAVDDFDLCRIA